MVKSELLAKRMAAKGGKRKREDEEKAEIVTAPQEEAKEDRLPTQEDPLDAVLEDAEEKANIARGKKRRAKAARMEGDVDSDDAEEALGGNDRRVLRTNLAQYESDMGHAMTGFNLKDEKASGKYDDDGNYEEGMKRDPWLFEVDTIDEDNRGKGTANLNRLAGQTNAPEKEAAPERSKLEHVTTIASLLQPNETVNKAIQRLGNDSEKARKPRPKGSRATAKVKTSLDELTEAVAGVVGQGEYGIYTMTVRQVQGLAAELQEEEDEAQKWMIQWAGQTEVHGPFAQSQMKTWAASKYLDAAKVRRLTAPGAPEEEWVSGSTVQL